MGTEQRKGDSKQTTNIQNFTLKYNNGANNFIIIFNNKKNMNGANLY